MQTVKERWHGYWKYGRKYGLSEENAEDFAQTAYLRYLKAGSELTMKWVFADFKRELHGREGSPRGRATTFMFVEDDEDYIAPDRFVLSTTMQIVVDEMLDRGIPYRLMVRRLAVLFGVSIPDMTLLVRSLRR